MRLGDVRPRFRVPLCFVRAWPDGIISATSSLEPSAGPGERDGMNDRDKAERLAAQLESHPDFRVLRRLDPSLECPGVAGSRIGQAVILDTETTGTDAASDKVIELALVKFEYCRATGKAGRVLEVYDGLEDPGMPIPPESTAIHGITDDMVAGKRLDDAAIASVLDGVGIVIAHNAGFDRPFAERRLPVFEPMAWACSWVEVPWSGLGLGGAKLEYLAYRYGFFFDGHRAEMDCRALLEVLRRPIPGDAGAGPALRLLLESARQPSYRVWATGSPFESKDLLRAKGYRWEAEQRVWFRDLAVQEPLEDELAWLKEAVYGGKSASVEVEKLDARTRYSERGGTKERVRL
jgi:DNA polymerase-3 subunit epsilon